MENAIFILSLLCDIYFQHKIPESNIFARKVELTIEENQTRGYPSHLNYTGLVADKYVRIKKPNTFGSEQSHREYWIIQIPNLLTNIHSIEKISVFFCRQISTLNDGNISSIAFDLNYTEETYNLNENYNNLCRVVSFKRHMLYDTKTNTMLKTIIMSSLGYDIYSHSSSIRVTIYFNKTVRLMRRFSRVDHSKKTNKSSVLANYCRKVPLNVSFYDIGWSGRILSPTTFQSYQCVGHCSLTYMIPSGDSSDNSIIRALLIDTQQLHRKTHSGSSQKKFYDNLPKEDKDFIAPPCCVPISYKPLQVSILDDNNQIKMIELQNIVVDSCGCR